MIKNETTPEVGMGATYGVGSDCYPYTIVEILSPRRIVVQADSYTALPGNDPFSENQSYEYFRNPQGHLVTLSLRKNGRWVPVGQSNYGGFAIGHRRFYQDPCF